MKRVILPAVLLVLVGTAFISPGLAGSEGQAGTGAAARDELPAGEWPTSSGEASVAGDDRIQRLPLPPWLRRELVGGEPRTRPFLYWRAWADKPLPVVPAFLFCLVTGLAAWALLPGTLGAAEELCRSSFWKSLLAGAFTVVAGAIFARCLFVSQIGQPLAWLTLGVLEFGLILGTAVSSKLIGDSILARSGLAGKAPLAGRAWLERAIPLAVGTALVCLLLLIPGFAGFPRIGIRLVMLVAFLGFGGVVRAATAGRR
ncbi:MAG TPA: hypothetical protein V6D08_15320, partial [Candidatus Obscuribacterales bacterium]